ACQRNFPLELPDELLTEMALLSSAPGSRLLPGLRIPAWFESRTTKDNTLRISNPTRTTWSLRLAGSKLPNENRFQSCVSRAATSISFLTWPNPLCRNEFTEVGSNPNRWTGAPAESRKDHVLFFDKERDEPKRANCSR